MPLMTMQAHAKLNLSLDITGTAPDGYHTLDMVMQTISLCDTVTLEAAEVLTLVAPHNLPQGEDNLMVRAAVALRQAAGIRAGAHMTLEKNIPSQAGMGGGSADAAAVLRGLNRLWGLDWSVDRLCEIGLQLGSDVPFALRGGTARVRRVGDIIEPIAGAVKLWFALAMPEGGVNTGACYRRYDELGAGHRPDNDQLLAALCRGDLAAMAKYDGNALQRAAVSLNPDIDALLEQFRALDVPLCAMTGSGAAVYAICQSEAAANEVCSALKGAAWSAVACSAGESDNGTV